MQINAGVCVLPVGEDSAAVVNTDGQNFISDHFTVVWPAEMLRARTKTQTLKVKSHKEKWAQT